MSGSHSPIQRSRSAILLEEDSHEDIFIKLARWQKQRTCTVCGVCLGIFLLTCVIAGATFEATDGLGDRTWFAESTARDRWDSAKAAEDAIFEDTLVPPQTQSMTTIDMTLLYWADENVLTPTHVATMYEMEQKYLADQQYLDQICFVDPGTGLCSPDGVQSLLTDLQGLDQAGIDAYLDTQVDESRYWHFHENYNATKTSTHYQSHVMVGLPYPVNQTAAVSDYKNSLDDPNEQGESVKDWMKPIWESQKSKDGVTHYAVNYAIFIDLYMEEVNNSQTLLFFAIVLLGCYLTFHLRSLFLSIRGIMIIVLSFSPSYTIYRWMYQITTFDPINVVIIFVLLGIGADDMFVINDAFIQSAYQGFTGTKDEILQKRIAFAISRAGRATALTSVTTAIAFFCTSVSRLTPLRAFGAWAGTVILVNYLDFIILFPCLIMFQQRYPWLSMGWCCKMCSKDDSQKVDTSPALGKIEMSDNARAAEPEINVDDGPELGQIQDKSNANEIKLRTVERFFRDTFGPFITSYHKFLYFFLVLTYVVGIIALTQLEPPPEQEAYTTDDAEYGIITNALEQFHLSPDTAAVDVKILWGAEGKADNDGLDKWDSSEYGDVIWDNTFDLSSVSAQQHIDDVCQNLKNSSLVYDSEVVSCFMDQYKTFESGMSFPYSWSTDPAAQRVAFLTSMGNFLSSTGAQYALSREVGFVDGELKYVRVDTRTTIKWGTSATSAKPLRSDWNDYVSEKNAAAPAGVDKAFQTSFSGQWVWIETEEALIDGAVLGIILALIFAGVSLLVFTGNWRVSALALTSVLGILLTITFFIWANGWYFGVVESFTIVIIIGFSVDYVVHVGHSYLEYEFAQTRKERTQHALLTMGISVLSGAVTTFLSGFPLAFSKLMIYRKMGYLIMATVTTALLYTLLIFSSLLVDFGPHEEQGDLTWICAKFTGADETSDKSIEISRRNSNEGEC